MYLGIRRVAARSIERTGKKSVNDFDNNTPMIIYVFNKYKHIHTRKNTF